MTLKEKCNKRHKVAMMFAPCTTCKLDHAVEAIENILENAGDPEQVYYICKETLEDIK